METRNPLLAEQISIFKRKHDTDVSDDEIYKAKKSKLTEENIPASSDVDLLQAFHSLSIFSNKNIPLGKRTLHRNQIYSIDQSIVEVYYKDKKAILLSGNINYAEVVRHNFPAICLGKTNEATYIDPASLQNRYESFCTAYEQEISSFKMSIPELLKLVCKHVQHDCGKKNSTHDEKRSARDEMKRNISDFIEIGAAKKKVGIVELNLVMDMKAGNCRYHAMYTAFLLSKLIEKKFLADGEVYFCRDKIRSGGAHTWICYRPKNSTDLFSIDAYWKDGLVFNLSTKMELKKAKEKKYGDSAIEEMVKRYSI